MRSAVTWIACAFVILGGAAVISSAITVRTLYRASGPVMARPDPTPSSAVSATAHSGSAGIPGFGSAVPTGTASDGPGDSLERIAVTLVNHAAAGKTSEALNLAEGLSAELLYQRIGAYQPRPVQAGLLPSPIGTPREVLVWVEYQRPGNSDDDPADVALRYGAYRLTIAEGKVTDVIGPILPLDGYATLPPNAFSDQRGVKVPADSWLGRPLLLIAPRAPEPGLAQALSQLLLLGSENGIAVKVVADLRSPDWMAAAREAGYDAPLWRVKQDLEAFPSVTSGRLLGAAGLLIDRHGRAVASLAVLDPSRYGLPPESLPEVAVTVLRAYTLLP